MVTGLPPKGASPKYKIWRDRRHHFGMFAWVCECKDFEHRGFKKDNPTCKHIEGVQDDLDQIPENSRNNKYSVSYTPDKLHTFGNKTSWMVLGSHEETYVVSKAPMKAQEKY